MKEIYALIGLAIAVVGYVPYLWSIIYGSTRPHIFTWVIWATLTTIAFFAQWSDDAGPGAWVTGFTALIAFVIIALSFQSGEKNITRSDWLTFMAAWLAMPLWYITQDPVFAVILVTIIDALGFYPTFRKSYFKPWEEMALVYTLSGIKFIFALLALEHVSVITALYPLSLVVMNLGFVVMVLWRRHIYKSGAAEKT